MKVTRLAYSTSVLSFSSFPPAPSIEDEAEAVVDEEPKFKSPSVFPLWEQKPEHRQVLFER